MATPKPPSPSTRGGGPFRSREQIDTTDMAELGDAGRLRNSSDEPTDGATAQLARRLVGRVCADRGRSVRGRGPCQVANPVPAIVRGTEFEATKRFFAAGPSSTRSLLTSTAQALLYTVIRNLRPNNVVEIGTYKGGTSETLCRALQANGFGTLHTVSPLRCGALRCAL